MSLHPGLIIGRYELRSLLGAGGMGEVYRAFDRELEREVALKFLKQTDDAEKLRRFRQEAKAVSALNHPNILTIHKFGKYENYQYIVSELVAGENLREVVAGRNLSVGEILDIGIQIGNALAAAHAVGIIHRDIKPENVMLLPDGYVKVLDFGLAKFVGAEQNLASDADAPTASLIQTRAGMIIGTVNYMSPEQLRGKKIDARADVWSLGIVLFELLTRRRPFNGESVSDVIAAVLEHSLPPLSRFDANIPKAVEIVVAKALEKDQERRFENARAFVTALKTARSATASDDAANANRPPFSKSFHSQKTIYTNPNQIPSAVTNNLSGLFIAGNKISWRAIAFAGFLLTAVAGIGGWLFFYQPLFKQSPVKQMKSERFTTSGNVVNAAISPDGNFVVYVQRNDGRESLWLRQVNETAGKELIPANSESYGGLTFKPDGDWIYYTIFSHAGTGTLYRIPLLGDTPQPVAKDVDSAIAFAPDAKRYAFIRSNPREGSDQIIVSGIDGGGERILSERRRPEFYVNSSRESLSWSPDGKYIACPFGKIGADGEFMTIVEINVETGEQKFLTDARWSRVGRVVWTKNADELLITATEPGTQSFQIRRLSRADGKVQNVTGELSDFYNLSLDKDSTRLLAVIYEKSSTLYTASIGQPNALLPLAGGSYDGIGGVRWAANDRIFYVSMESRNRDIWATSPDGGKPRRLTFDEAADENPSVSADGNHLVFVSSRTGVPHVWRTNQDGGEAKQLTDKGGESSPEITPDSRFVIYSRIEDRPVIWKIPVEGGAPAQLTEEPTHGAAVSPDGKYIVCLTRGETLDSPTLLALVSVETGEIVQTFKPAGILSSPGLPATVRWLPDNQKFAYVANVNGISNVWTQTLAGGAPKKLTDFTADRIFSFDFSKDGKRIVYARGVLRNDLALIENF